MGQGIQVLKLRPVGIMPNRSILPVRSPENLVDRLAVGKFLHRVIEFLAYHEINGASLAQGLLRQNRYMRAYECNFDFGVRFLNTLCQADVSGKSWRARVKH